MSDPVILHCDCNGFFASVEQLSRPELRKVPMAVYTAAAFSGLAHTHSYGLA